MTLVTDPSDIVGMSFGLITVAMFATAIFVLVQRRRAAEPWQLPLIAGGTVALICTIVYIMLTLLWSQNSAVPSALRFVDWQLTVPLQTVIFYLVLRAMGPVGPALFWRLLVASSVLSAAAYLGATGFISPTLGFVASLICGLYILGELYLGEAGQRNAACADPEAKATFNALRLIATIGWAIYPLGYFMEHLGGGVDGASINLIYNLADFLNKIAFVLVIVQEATRDRRTQSKF